MFIPDIIYSPGLARNSFFAGWYLYLHKERVGKNSKIDENWVTKTSEMFQLESWIAEIDDIFAFWKTSRPE